MLVLTVVIAHTVLSFLPAVIIYMLTKQHSQKFWKMFIQCWLIGAFPLGMLIYMHEVHGTTLDDMRTLGIVWVVLQAILGMWTVSKYK